MSKNGGGIDAETAGSVCKRPTRWGKTWNLKWVLVCFVVIVNNLMFVLCVLVCVDLYLCGFGERRVLWIVSICSFCNCKMRVIQLSFLKWWLFSLKIPRSFSINSESHCKDSASLAAFLEFYSISLSLSLSRQYQVHQSPSRADPFLWLVFLGWIVLCFSVFLSDYSHLWTSKRLMIMCTSWRAAAPGTKFPLSFSLSLKMDIRW